MKPTLDCNITFKIDPFIAKSIGKIYLISIGKVYLQCEFGLLQQDLELVLFLDTLHYILWKHYELLCLLLRTIGVYW